MRDLKETILSLNNEEARTYFLQASKYCTIQLPKYFDFQPLLTTLEKQIGRKCLFEILAKDSNNKSITPKDFEFVNYKLLTNKNGNFDWRPLQIINPAIYICLVNRITSGDSWNTIKSRFEYFQENRKIRCYSIPLITTKTNNQSKTDVSESIINWWEEIEQQSIELALHYNCVLSTDIMNCYSSIYTHSIGWALHGKEVARNHRNDSSPGIIGCVIDDIIQAMSYRQTNGIPQGSVLMDFIAEMVLGYADRLLSDKLNSEFICNDDYIILRYRDDYKIFTNTQEDCVRIAKILSEVLSDLNLRLNTQKTIVSNSIIRDVIKPDKLYWNESKHGEKTLQNHLLLIHSLAEKHPNSGSLSKAMSDFINRLYSLKSFNECSIKVIASILVDIAYNNPRTYPAVIVCLGKILSLETNTTDINEICSLIENKFENKPNVGHWKVWLQRLTIKSKREKEHDSDEKLCRIAAHNEDCFLWNIDWLKPEYQQIFHTRSIVNEDVINNLSDVPEKEEVQLFGY